MKKFNKISIVILALVMAFSFAGCSSKTSDETQSIGETTVDQSAEDSAALGSVTFTAPDGYELSHKSEKSMSFYDGEKMINVHMGEARHFDNLKVVTDNIQEEHIGNFDCITWTEDGSYNAAFVSGDATFEIWADDEASCRALIELAQ